MQGRSKRTVRLFSLEKTQGISLMYTNTLGWECKDDGARVFSVVPRERTKGTN